MQWASRGDTTGSERHAWDERATALGCTIGSAARVGDIRSAAGQPGKMSTMSSARGPLFFVEHSVYPDDSRSEQTVTRGLATFGLPELQLGAAGAGGLLLPASTRGDMVHEFARQLLDGDTEPGASMWFSACSRRFRSSSSQAMATHSSSCPCRFLACMRCLT